MRDAKLIKTEEIEIDAIDVSSRLRPISETAVQSLIASINELGRMNDEISVRQVRHQKNRLVLIAGGHRVEAAKRLGWTHIAAKVFDCSDDWARLWELDDNLAHAELDALEMSTFLAERQKVFERIHPEVKAHRFKGNQHSDVLNDMMSFSRTVSEKRGISERHVQRLTAAGRDLSPEDIELLRHADRRPTLKDLTDLTKLHGETRLLAIKSFSAGEAKSINKAAAQWQPQREHSELNRHDQLVKRLEEAWSQANAKARREFVESFAKDIRRYLPLEGDE